uniref:Uncharacterized protein n=1 Tax=Arundo donax TaxID=35708 RepID=A0A0A8Z9P3_ARUDO
MGSAANTTTPTATTTRTLRVRRKE